MTDAELEDVMAALAAGERMQLGGGRSFSTYAMHRGQLVIINCCDGELEEYPCSEAMLRAAFADAPHVFRQYVAWWKAKPQPTS